MRGIQIRIAAGDNAGLTLDLAESEIVATTYAVNNLRDVESRQAHYSNTFRLPMTMRNLETLELPQHINTFSRIPYRKIQVQVLEDEMITLDATLQIVRIEDGYIECEMTGGNYNFFELIEGRKLTDIKLTSYSHVWNMENIVASAIHTWRDAYTYPVANYGRNLSDIKPVDDFYPALYVKFLIEAIAGAVGYRVKGTFYETNVFERLLLLTYKFPELDEDFVRSYSAKVGYDSPSSNEYTFLIGNENASQKIIPLVFTSEEDNVQGWFDGSNDNYNLTNGEFTAGTAGIYSFSYTGAFYYLGPVFLSARLYKNGSIISDIGLNRSSASGTFEDIPYNFPSVFAVAGDVFKIDLRVKKRGFLNSGVRLNVYFNERTVWDCKLEPFVVPGAKIDIASVLSDMAQKDIFLLLANQFNLLFLTDTRNKVLYIEPFDSVIANWQKATDFSGRLDFSEPPVLSFQLDDYGQSTILQYDDATHPGSLILDNEHLPTTVVGYESPFALQGLPILTIKEQSRFEVWSEGGQYITDPVQDYVQYLDKYYKCIADYPTSQTPNLNSSQWEEISYLDYLQLYTINEVAPPLALLNPDSTEVVTIYENGDTEEYTRPITIEPLKFPALIAGNYRYLEAALSNGKFLRVLLRLDSIDIATLDFTKPIRLQSDHIRYGEMVTGYFFIQAIDQYQHGMSDSTWCDLMRIEIPTLTSYTKPTDNRGYLLLPESGYVLQPTGGRIELP